MLENNQLEPTTSVRESNLRIKLIITESEKFWTGRFQYLKLLLKMKSATSFSFASHCRETCREIAVKIAIMFKK